MEVFKIILLVCIFFLTGCDESLTNTFQEKKMFMNRLTIENFCKDGEKINPAQEINCTISAEFNTDGTTLITLLESQYNGTYYISDDKIISLYPEFNDSNQIEYLLTSDSSRIVDNFLGYTWFLID